MRDDAAANARNGPRPVQDPFNQENRPRKRSNILLSIDSWIDSSIWNAGFRVRRDLGGDHHLLPPLPHPRGLEGGVRDCRRGHECRHRGVRAAPGAGAAGVRGNAGNWRARDDFAVTFLDRYGNEIGRRGIIHEDSAPVDQLPDHFIKAVLATEDRRFFEHFGIDFLGLARAMTENVKANSVVQGGSTITQQLAKNLFLTNERTIERKVKEAFLAFWLEANLSKRRF
jgi:penicillin-binding protein 1A